MGNERPHADHVDVVLGEKQDVVGQIVQRLAGQADHHAGADLIADVAQHGEAFHARFEGLIRGMDFGEQRRIGGFDAQQIAMRAGFVEALVGLADCWPMHSVMPRPSGLLFAARFPLDPATAPAIISMNFLSARSPDWITIEP